MKNIITKMDRFVNENLDEEDDIYLKKEVIDALVSRHKSIPFDDIKNYVYALSKTHLEAVAANVLNKK
jgi:hypothetical protein